MSIPSRGEAQRRADEIAGFRMELARLEADGVLRLDPAQREAMDRHHEQLLGGLSSRFDIDRSARAVQLSLGMRVASFLGALGLASSVFFLFYQFWGRFGETAQVTILVGASMASFALAIGLSVRDASGYYAKLAAMVAFVCFVLNLSMLGQIFNLAPTDRALLPWAALAFLLAYACDLRLLLAAGICCLIAYAGARVGEWGGLYWLSASRRPENYFPVAALLFAIPSAMSQRAHDGFAATWRVFGLLCILLPILVLAHWGRASYLVSAANFDARLVQGGYEVAGFALSGLAIWIGIRRAWPELVNTGITFFVIFLYTKLFDWWWEAMPKYLFFLTQGLIALLILVVLKRLRQAGRTAEGGA